MAIDFESDLFEEEEEVTVLLQLYKDKKQAIENRRKLWSLITSIHLTLDEIEHGRQVSELEASVNTVLDLYGTIYEKDKEYEKLTKLIGDLKKVSVSIESKTWTLEELTKKFDTEFPDICPLCNKPK